MLCEVPSRNTTCVICAGKVMKCSDFENLHIFALNVTLIEDWILFSSRVQLAVLIAKALASVPNGWENLCHPNNNSYMATRRIC